MPLDTKVLRRGALAILALLCSALIGQAVVVVADHYGFSETIPKLLDPMTAFFGTIVFHPVFPWFTGAAIGFAAGVYLDAWVRRREFPQVAIGGAEGAVTPPTLFDAWKDVERLSLVQAAHLWHGEDPETATLQGASAARLRYFEQAVTSGELVPGPPIGEAPIAAAFRRSSLSPTFDAKLTVTRADLKALGAARRDRPAFLTWDEPEPISGPDALSGAVNMDYADFDTRRLKEDLTARVAFRFFNGNPEQLFLKGFNGCFRFRPMGSGGDYMPLAEPILIEDDGKGFPPHTDKLLIFEQRFSGNAAALVMAAIEDKGAEIDLGDFEVVVRGQVTGQEARLRLWSALNVFNFPARVHSGKIVRANLSVSTKPEPSLR